MHLSTVTQLESRQEECYVETQKYLNIQKYFVLDYCTLLNNCYL